MGVCGSWSEYDIAAAAKASSVMRTDLPKARDEYGARSKEVHPNMTTNLPPELLAAIAAADGRISIVVGAGASTEAPTNLGLTKDYALAAHAALRANGTLTEDCANPEDLTSVADAVLEALHSLGGDLAAIRSTVLSTP